MSLEEINRLDIVDYLAALGIDPKKVSGQNYWYLSPLPGRNEKTPSFKVNRKLNRWYDFGTGEGATLIDFGIRYYNCTIHEFLEKFSGLHPDIPIPAAQPHSNVPQAYPARPDEPEKTITILDTRPLTSFYLTRYLWERRIPLDVAQRYCREVQYTFGPKPYYAIGFPNDAGGYELRNRYHKYSSRPKGPTHLRHGSPHLAVFEGFFDMLTFVTFIALPEAQHPDLLVLNSTAFFESALPLMDPYRRKHLFLDNDPTGDKYSLIARDPHAGFIDHRALYKGYKDLNAWACHIGKPLILPFQSAHPPAPKSKPPE
jgi:Toprim-like